MNKEKPSGINFVQTGKTIACGHCDSIRYGEGLKLIEAVEKIKGNDYVCDCICHTQEPMEWEREFGANTQIEITNIISLIYKKDEK